MSSANPVVSTLLGSGSRGVSGGGSRRYQPAMGNPQLVVPAPHLMSSQPNLPFRVHRRARLVACGDLAKTRRRAHPRAMSYDQERMAASPHHVNRARRERHPGTSADHEPVDDVRGTVGNSGMGQLLDPRTSDTIENELGSGKPLAEAAGTARSTSAGADVRIHDDGTAAQLSRELGAVAFTYGRDIFLAGNAPDLKSNEGQAMLRHELTHVRQHAESGTTRPTRVSSPNSPAEQQAAQAAHSARHARAPAPGLRPRAVHRPAEEEEAQPLRAETAHRQEEEETEVQPLRAEAVHRQEEEETEVQPLRAEAVHRQEDEEEAQI